MYVLPNFTNLEQITFQKANRFFYDVAVGRVQVKLPWSLIPPVYFLAYDDYLAKFIGNKVTKRKFKHSG